MAGWEGSFADRERITDSNFTVFGKVPKKFHIECESENSFPEYNSDEQKLEELKTEYKVILQRLDELEGQGVIGAFDKRTIIELSGDVIKEIAQKYKNVQKGVGDMKSSSISILTPVSSTILLIVLPDLPITSPIFSGSMLNKIGRASCRERV